MQRNLLVGSMTQQSRKRPRRARVWRLGMQPPGQPGPAAMRAAATNPNADIVQSRGNRGPAQRVAVKARGAWEALRPNSRPAQHCIPAEVKEQARAFRTPAARTCGAGRGRRMQLRHPPPTPPHILVWKFLDAAARDAGRIKQCALQCISPGTPSGPWLHSQQRRTCTCHVQRVPKPHARRRHRTKGTSRRPDARPAAPNLALGRAPRRSNTLHLGADAQGFKPALTAAAAAPCKHKRESGGHPGPSGRATKA